MKSNADLIAEGLEQAGVRYLFGYIAGTNARLIEALHGGALRGSEPVVIEAVVDSAEYDQIL